MGFSFSTVTLLQCVLSVWLTEQTGQFAPSYGALVCRVVAAHQSHEK
jgi:hypothetical protein